jgi:cysteine-S-conjugate beta-lyase
MRNLSVTVRSTFHDNAVPLDLLRQRAFNSRWAQQEPDVIPLTAADPDFRVCPAVRQSLITYAQEGVMSYGPPLGLPEFRSAVATWFRVRRAMACVPEDVFATDSAASGMAAIARASLQPGDEVLIPDPVDFLFEHTIRRAGGVAKRVSIGFTTTAEEYIAALATQTTERTRMIWLCNPHNPLGRVFPAAWLRTVAEWAIARGLKILSDEIWSDIVYQPHTYTSVAALSPEIAQQTVTVYGFSKNFALAGLRVGCIICPDPQWREAIVEAADAPSTVFGVSVLSQIAAIAAMTEGQDWLAEFQQHLQQQRDYAVQRLSKWPQTLVNIPQGTYVIFPQIADADSEALCEQIRLKARVALVPGAARWFGPGANGHLRICFATSHGILQEAFDRLDNFWSLG